MLGDQAMGHFLAPNRMESRSEGLFTMFFAIMEDMIWRRIQCGTTHHRCIKLHNVADPLCKKVPHPGS